MSMTNLMTVLFFASTSLFSPLSYAQSADPRILSDELIEFVDGTVEIRAPRVRFPGGSDFGISVRSDKNGVCKFFGYPGALSGDLAELEASRTDRCSAPTVVLDRNGALHERNECGVFNTNASVRAVRCQPRNGNYRVSENYLERNAHANGTVTFVAPWFSVAGASRTDLMARMYINGDSDHTGVCRHFGMTSYVADSAVVESRCEVMRAYRTVELDRNGRLKKVGNCEDEMIVSLSCR